MLDASTRRVRARKTILAVPGSSSRFIEKSKTLPVDCLFLDLEDAVAPAAKAQARKMIVDALHQGGWACPTITVRVNDWLTPWTVYDTIEVVEGAGAYIDAIVLPKVQSADHVKALDMVITQAEIKAGLPVGKIGMEIQIEDAPGLLHVDQIAQASPRIETLVFGPGDYMASMGMRGLSVGSQLDGYTADAFHYAMMRILIAARAYGLQALDGPYVSIRDPQGFETSAKKAAALGYDGKWVVHPSQINICNEVFSPTDAQIERARRIVAAYEHAGQQSGGAVGAIVVDDEMVDEAGMKVAQAMLAKLEVSGR